jgi:hypothetical protein
MVQSSNGKISCWADRVARVSGSGEVVQNIERHVVALDRCAVRRCCIIICKDNGWEEGVLIQMLKEGEIWFSRGSNAPEMGHCCFDGKEVGVCNVGEGLKPKGVREAWGEMPLAMMDRQVGVKTEKKTTWMLRCYD